MPPTLVVAAGGDGTVSEVVNGLAPELDRVILGVLPAGEEEGSTPATRESQVERAPAAC